MGDLTLNSQSLLTYCRECVWDPVDRWFVVQSRAIKDPVIGSSGLSLEPDLPSNRWHYLHVGLPSRGLVIPSNVYVLTLGCLECVLLKRKAS